VVRLPFIGHIVCCGRCVHPSIALFAELIDRSRCPRREPQPLFWNRNCQGNKQVCEQSGYCVVSCLDSGRERGECECADQVHRMWRCG
jgi:hypothetical protein